MSARKKETGPGGAGRKSSNTPILARLLSIREAAELLGLRPNTLYSWVASRRIPVVKLRRSVRIEESVLEELISANRVPALEVRR